MPGSSRTDVELTIIVASSGRPSLARAIDSATRQMLPGDQLVVIFDASGDFGDNAHNRGLDAATGTHIICLDDDDEFRPRALDAIRKFVGEHPRKIGIFRVSYGPGGDRPPLNRPLNLLATQTGMYVVPNIRGKVGRFGRPPGERTGHIGDYRFIVESVAAQGEPIWCQAVTQNIRPEKNLYKRLRYQLRLRERIARLLGLPLRDPPSGVRRYPAAEEWACELLSSAGVDPAIAAPPGVDARVAS